MAANPPAEVGELLSELDTPALVIDLDAFERNITKMADLATGFGVALRPHAKTHKSPIIARRQIDLGAVGVCCQKVSEAEIMVAGGVDNVLVSNQVVGDKKLARLAALARQAKISVCVDNAANVDDLDAAAARFGATIDLLVEIDVGSGRCGVPPGKDAVELATAVAAKQNLRFAGLQAYHGSAQHIRDPEARRAAVDGAIALTRQTVDLLHDAGLDCPVIGGAGTGTFPFEAGSALYTELQVGSYIFLDADYARNEGNEGAAQFEHALFVYATVMSRPDAKRAIVDAGLKSFSFDSGPPRVYSMAGADYARASDEHGVLELSDASDGPGLGDKLLIVPGHCDPTVNLYDWYVCVRGLASADAYVEAFWPVAARGAVY